VAEGRTDEQTDNARSAIAGNSTTAFSEGPPKDAYRAT